MSSPRPENGKTLFIHIGMPKAGSSSIQGLLHTNRRALAAVGVDVLPLGRNHTSILSQICQQGREGVQAFLNKRKPNWLTDATNPS